MAIAELRNLLHVEKESEKEREREREREEQFQVLVLGGRRIQSLL